jgi:hypothetical protein
MNVLALRQEILIDSIPFQISFAKIVFKIKQAVGLLRILVATIFSSFLKFQIEVQ